MTSHPAAPAPPRRAGRWRAPLVACTAASAALAIASLGTASSGTAGAGPRGDLAAVTGESTGDAMLGADVEALRRAGVPADDPKLALLLEELATLRALEDEDAVSEPRVDLSEVAGGGGARDVEAGSGARWDSGPVTCEPVPGHLTAADIAGATCTVVPQDDGTVRYVARRPDGSERSVVFGADRSPLGR